MSTYQYYEFRAMDSALTKEQREEVDSLSSRATVTSHQAIFPYLYQGFRGDEEELMETHFDMMYYKSNLSTVFNRYLRESATQNQSQYKSVRD